MAVICYEASHIHFSLVQRIAEVNNWPSTRRIANGSTGAFGGYHRHHEQGLVKHHVLYRAQPN